MMILNRILTKVEHEQLLKYEKELVILYKKCEATIKHDYEK